MIARLTDPWFEAEFIGSHDPLDHSHHYQGGEIRGAQGLFLWCPCGFNDPRYRTANGGKPHALLLPFENPQGAPPLPGERVRWQMSGTGLQDLTLSPSVLIGPRESPCWHGWIQNGEVR